MVTIRQNTNSISVTGHANYAESGKDIVCAAVSALAQNLMYSIAELTEDYIIGHAEPGDMRIEFQTLSDGSKLLVDSFMLGVQAIAENYPENSIVEKAP